MFSSTDDGLTTCLVDIRCYLYVTADMCCSSAGWVVTRMLFIRKSNDEGNSISLASNMLQKLHIFLLYLFGLFALAFEKGMMTFRRINPARVAHSIT